MPRLKTEKQSLISKLTLSVIALDKDAHRLSYEVKLRKND